MVQIVAVEPLRRKKGWVRLQFDDGEPIDLPDLALVKRGLRSGDSVSDDDLRDLLHESTTAACQDAAYRYLTSRPRSVAELRTRLRHGGYEDAVIETVLGRLRDQKLIDDAEFASFWVEQRTRFSPRSRRAIGYELRGKGVEGATVAAVTSDIDDTATALELARSRLHRLAGLDDRTRRDRLTRFLAQRGYAYETIATVFRGLRDDGQGIDGEESDEA